MRSLDGTSWRSPDDDSPSVTAAVDADGPSYWRVSTKGNDTHAHGYIMIHNDTDIYINKNIYRMQRYIYILDTHYFRKTTRFFNSSLQDLHVLHSRHYAAWVLRISLLGVIIAIARLLGALPFEDKLLHMEGCQNKGSDAQRDTSKI